MKDKIRGSLVGGAIGDALGYAVEFVGSYSSIQEIYGEAGITRLVTEKSRSGYANDSDKAVISDDTQMTLFTACGLLNAENPELRKCAIRDAYVEWYYTQQWHCDRRSRKCWIAEIPEMNQRRSPGGTCMSAMEMIIAGLEPHNNSKGCGGVMRTVPVALYGAVDNRMTIEQSVKLAGEAAELTHKHPLGWLPSALEAYIIYRLLHNNHPVVEDFKAYIDEGVQMLEALYPNQEDDIHNLKALVDEALNLIDSPNSDVVNIETSLGGGWVGDEALAIAIYCVAKYFNDFEKAIVAAVNHSGDSDSTGAVTGNIIGTIVGYDAIPQYYKDDLELHDVILKVADDLLGDSHQSDVPIYNSYKVTDWLYAGEYPGDKGADGAEMKIRQCLDFGITHFIDLTEEGELIPYEPLINGRAEYTRFPIRDVSVPNDTESVRELMEKIKGWHNENPLAKFYIHCWGGVGRTGVIVACFLGYFCHLDSERAIQKLRLLFGKCPKSVSRVTPETFEQVDFVCRFIQEQLSKDDRLVNI